MLLIGSAFVWADEPKPVDENGAEVLELEKRSKQHLSDHADDAVKKDCQSALELAGQLTDAVLKTRCLNIIGLVLNTSKDNGVREAAINAIANSGDKSLYRFVVPYLSQPDKRMIPQLLMEAIECAGRLRADEAVLPMLDFEATSLVLTVNFAAIAALSNYGDAKGSRIMILKALVDDMRKDGQGTDVASRGRYDALAGAIVKACNKLTGRNCGVPEEWFELVDKYKTDLDALFGGK
jgi:hypothetical protein